MLTPYLQVPSLPIWGRIAIHPFGILVAGGVVIGAWLTRRRGLKLGLREEMVRSMIAWSVLSGFVGAHVVDVLMYQRGDPAERLAALMDPRMGLSSMGGFAGAVLGLWVWCRRKGEDLLAHADSLAFGLAIGWMFGRLGCFLAHDHPGEFTRFFLGVDYPCPRPPCAPISGWVHVNPAFRRHDLGLYEALAATALSVFYLTAERFRPRQGFFVASIALFYGPLRFFLDDLRARDVEGADPRWMGLTPAQYAALGVSIVGVLLTVHIKRRAPECPST